jgi:N-acetylmuramoyl-L-alanine amidase
MDQTLLKKTALQCVALMLIVITFSYTVKQYHTVTIQASGQTTNDVTSANNSDDQETLDSNNADNQPVVKPDGSQPTTDEIMKKLGANYMVIKKPEGKQVELSLEDLYTDQSIKLTITGITSGAVNDDMIARVRDDQHFVGKPISVVKKDDDGNDILDYQNDLCHEITITSLQGENTSLFTDKVLIKLDHVYAYIVYEDSENFYIDLKKPSEVYDKVLVIDAGHGGKDVGAQSRNDQYYEKNINLEIVKDLKELLDKEKIKVYYTRTGDNTIYLRPRSTLANDVDCDYFISVHCNANKVFYPNGTEVLYYDKKYKNVNNSDLAKLFSKEIGECIPLKNRGIVKKHNQDVYIMNKAAVPMVLIEVGYITNNSDMDYLSKSENRKTIAQGIYNGIMKAYEKLPVQK